MSKEYTRLLSILGNVPTLGRMIFYDNFESLFKWTITGTGADYLGELDPSVAFHGNQSLFLRTRTAGAAEDDEVNAVFLSHLLPSQTLTMTVLFKLPDPEALKSINFTLYFQDGTQIYRGTIRYITSPLAWAYLNAAGTFTDFTFTTVALFINSWHRITLRINLNTHLYTDFSIDHHEVDMSSISLRPISNGDNTRMAAQITLASLANAPCSVNIDEVLIHEL